MNKAFEKILERLEERTSFLSDCTKYGNKDSEQQEKSYSTMMLYEVEDLVEDLKDIVQEVAEEYNNNQIYRLAMMYARNLILYGVDVTKEWETATQQSCALEQAYIRGRQYERDRFAKLQKEYNGGWIPCSERMPEEIESMFAKFKGTDKWDTAMFKKISDDVNVTVEYENGTRKTMTLHTNDGKWNTKYRLANYKVIAWQPLPEPYKESD